VKIVLTIMVKPRERLEMEKWFYLPSNKRATRANPNGSRSVPTVVQRLAVTLAVPPNPTAQPAPAAQASTTIQMGNAAYTVTPGLPLALEFEKLFIRPAVLQERDIIFTATNIAEWVDSFWNWV
jgi:hypothetical protein